MRETLWNVMVAVQQARRGRETRTTVPPPRRKRPTTLRSVRSLLVCDHYALLMDGDY